ncbi:MAG: 6-carboxytetrahydropterin synthase [Candidatus Latescibacterota bacterium]
METITVQGEFHAGHRLLGYDGGCAFVHGHTWRARLVVSAERLPRDGALDLSVDFRALKGVFRALDHKMIVSAQDGVFLDAGVFPAEGVVVVPGRNPTAENVAHYCLERAMEVLEGAFAGRHEGYRLEVTIQETESNSYTLACSVAAVGDADRARTGEAP